MKDMLDFETQDRLRAYGQQLDALTGPVSASEFGPSRVSRPTQRSAGRPRFHVAAGAAFVLLVAGGVAALLVGAGPGASSDSSLVAAADGLSQSHRSPSKGGLRMPTATVLGAAKSLAVAKQDMMVFPLTTASASFVSTFGAPRPIAGRQQGIELFAPMGSPVRAMRESEVVEVGVVPDPNERGSAALRFVVLRDGDATTYRYANLQTISKEIQPKATVRLGGVIGELGSSGAVPSHLHLEIRVQPDAVAISPAPLLRALAQAAPKGNQLSTSSMSPNGPIGAVDLSETYSFVKVFMAAQADGVALGAVGFTNGGPGGWTVNRHIQRSEQQRALRVSNCGPSIYAVYLMPPSACKIPTARLGQSAHEMGRAVDFTSEGRALTYDSSAFRWLQANGALYGWKNTEPDQPWHWEYTPV